MLLAITSELRVKLKDRGVPYELVYGPERMQQSTLSRPHIVIERDRGNADEAQEEHEPVIFFRHIRAVARIFAQATVAGPGPGDHERRADKIVDQMLLALREIVKERKTAWTIGPGRLLTAAELREQDLEAWPGVVYEQRFAIARGVADCDFAEAIADEATMGGEHGVGVSTTLDTSDSPGVSTDLPGAQTR